MVQNNSTKVNRDFLSEIILIVAGFILAETLVKKYLELTSGVTEWWVLPVLAIGLISTAISIRNGEKSKISGYSSWVMYILLILYIGLYKTSAIQPWTYIGLTLGTVIIQVLIVFLENLKKKEKMKKPKKESIFWKSLKETLKREIPLLGEQKYKKFNRWVVAISLITAMSLPFLILLITLKPLVSPFMDLLFLNFGSTAIGSFFAVLLLCILFFASLASSKILLSSIFSNQKQKWKAFVTYSLIITLFLCGFVFIHYVNGAPSTKWQTFSNGSYYSDINCKDPFGNFIVGHEVTCSFETKDNITNIHWEILLENHGGNETLINKSTFVVGNNLNHVSVKANVTIGESETKEITTRFYPKISTVEENYQRQKDFLTYFFGLLFICLITIPQLVSKLIKE